MRQWGNAWDVMVRDRTGSILLEFDRDQLVGKIVSNSAARIKNTQFIPGGGYIPFVEVWYPDEIPANAILAVYEIEPTNRFEFVPKRIE